MNSSLGISSHLGWAAVSAVLSSGGRIESVRTFRIVTANEGDRSALEPYHVAGGFQGLQRVEPPASPASAVARGIQRQRRKTLSSLGELIGSLQDWPVLSVAALFTGRGRIAPSLEQALASHTQIHIAEGNAVRESISRSCEALKIAVVKQDRRDFSDHFQRSFGVDERKALAGLNNQTIDNGGVWRKEEKLCALLALLALPALRSPADR